jgi:integrase
MQSSTTAALLPASPAISWSDWSDWMVAEDDKASATADEMVRAARHMTKMGVPWHQFVLSPAAAQDAVRPFLAAKVRSGHRHAVQKYQKALNLLARYLARHDQAFRALHWDVVKAPVGRLEPYGLAELDALRQYRHADRFVEARRRALLWLAEHTGLRRSELGRLTIEDLDEGRGALLVRRPAKRGAPRWIPLSRDAWSPKRPLQAWIQIHPHQAGPLWVTKTGTPLNANMMSREFWDVRVESGVRLNFNRFRHTRATELLEAGVRLDTIQGLYGHASPMATQHYARRSLETMERELARCRVPGFIRTRTTPRQRLGRVEPVRFHLETPVEGADEIKTAA